MPTSLVSRPNFNVVQPGAYSAVSTSELSTPAPNTGPIPAILGTTTGGKPLTPLYFTSPGILLNVLRSGEAYDGARFALRKAPQVCVVRVGKAVTQGSIELEGASGKLVKLLSLEYGSWVDSITVGVEAGPIIVLKYTDPSGNIYKETWNLSTLESGKPTNAKIAEAINGKLYGYTASNFVTAEAKAGTGELKTASASPLSGGGEEAPEAGNWTEALTSLESQEVSIIVAMTSEASIQAQVEEHCEVMSAGNARKERTSIAGAATGETVAKIIERVGNLRSKRTQFACPGTYQYNAKGEVTLYPPYYRAAMYAGMHCGLPDVATSLCHEETEEIAPETAYSTVQGGALDQLLLAGASPSAPKPGGGTWVIDSLSTSNEPAGYFRDFHKTRSADYVAKYVRDELEAKYVGGKNLNSSEESIALTAGILLKELQAAQIIRAFREPTVESGPTTGAVVTSSNSYVVSLPVMLVDANKYIFIAVPLQSPNTIQAGA
jgi:hypothetical protein